MAITFKQFATIDPVTGDITPTAEGEKVLQIVRFFTQSTPKRNYTLFPIGTSENGSICWGIKYTKPAGDEWFYSPVHDYLIRTAVDKLVFYSIYEFHGWSVPRPAPLPEGLANEWLELLQYATAMVIDKLSTGGILGYIIKRIKKIHNVDVGTWVNPNA